MAAQVAEELLFAQAPTRLSYREFGFDFKTRLEPLLKAASEVKQAAAEKAEPVVPEPVKAQHL